MKGFEEVINGYRTEGDWSIFITGSNSYLLSGELVTKLTGRYLEFEMFPLSFGEYEDMKIFLGKPIDTNPQAELTNYILESGFPRALFLDDPADKRKYVQGVIKEIFDNREMNYSYVQVAYTIALSKENEDREYRPLEMIADNYPKYVLTTDYLLQKRNGILHENIIDYMRKGKVF